VAHGLAQERNEGAVVGSQRWRLRAGLELGQFEKASPIERQALDQRARDHTADLMGVVANLGRGSVYGYGLGGGAKLHGEIDGGGAACFDDRLSREPLKSARFGRFLPHSPPHLPSPFI